MDHRPMPVHRFEALDPDERASLLDDASRRGVDGVDPDFLAEARRIGRRALESRPDVVTRLPR